MQFADSAPKNENRKFSRIVLKMLKISQFHLFKKQSIQNVPWCPLTRVSP